jgi:hypothetical protein
MKGSTAAKRPQADGYAPELRTAVVLSGIGTAGVYHAGVLRALHEAGVKIDVAAGRGIGAVGALFAAIDAAPQLWGDKGFWTVAQARGFYRWLPALRAFVGAVAVSLALVAAPLAAAAVGLIVFPLDFLARMAGVGGTSGLVGAYIRTVAAAFAPDALPTWLPRAVVLVLTAAALVLFVRSAAAGGAPRRGRGASWWRLLPPPLSTLEIEAHCWQTLWHRLGGGRLKQPPPAELGRRYVELLAENLDQPGFRELVLTVHDLDAHRDLVFALVGDLRRSALFRRAATSAADVRRAEVLDLAGAGRDLLADAVAGALAVPAVTASHPLTFQPESFWRGETHRTCDRPAALVRLLDELADLGVEQAIVVSAAPESPGPHTLSSPRLDLRARVGEYLQSAEAAAVRDAIAAAGPRISRLFLIRPGHNPIGPFDLAGGFDEQSDRRQSIGELLNRGYEDAYRQFIEPVMAL